MNPILSVSEVLARRMSPSKSAAAAILVLGVILAAPAPAQKLPDFSELVSRNSAGVVNISTTQTLSRESLPRDFEIPDLPEDSPFRDFFKRFLDELPEHRRNTQSLGSGFVLSSDGYILTSAHVIKDASEIVVRFKDRREFEAEVVGQDERSDVALLKVPATDLNPLDIGDPGELDVGEWVLAIGSPFGFESTATAGIVSAKGRSLPNENYVPFIQTDVAINPGNSGGPLFDLDGQVVGINSQIFSRTGGFMGLSFAIPIDMAMNVVDQLRTKGRVTRGWLGILIQDVTRELAESFDMGKPIGALVARVLPDSPAEQAGIEVGDVIVEYDDRQVSTSAALPPMVGSTKVGSTVEVKIIREGEPKRLEITISELPEDDELKLSRGGGGQDGVIEGLDIVVSELTPDQKENLDGKPGVYVESVDGGGTGAQAGLRKGDVLLRFNNVEIEDVAHLQQMVDEVEAGKSVAVLVQRRGSPLFLALKIGEK